MRVPSTIASLAVSLAIEPSRPFSLEVVGDPHEAFSPGAVVHPLRGFFRWWFRRQLRSQCVSACGVAYVTRESLQRRYPFQSTAFSTYYSDIELDDSAFVKCPRQTSFSVARHRIVAVGSLEQLYKGPDVLVEAARICIAEGIDLEIIWLGDGKFRPKLLDSVHSLGLSERISFTGQVPGGASVRRYLDKADLFILPSRTEGLPRALIEAMARGLPCLGSDVGGIPELLHAEDLVKPGDADDLARQIKEVLSSQERRSRMSTRNLLQASQYHENLLRPRRDEFYAHVRDCTHIWNRGSYPK
jgi:glycosyltransferase involved in cell wall biosynthesis